MSRRGILHLILVSNRLATAKTLAVTPRLLLLAGAFLVALVLAASLLLSWVSVQFRLPFVQPLLLSMQQGEAQKTQEFVRENMNVLATRLGQMQAQLMHLDSLGERLSALAGLKSAEKSAAPRGGQGGPLVEPTRTLSPALLQQELERLSQRLESRADSLSALESWFMDQRVRRSLLPTVSPMATAANGSGFGLRLDPIAKVRALHEGIDFVAEPGTPVMAAAGGVVAVAELHPQYGNLIEVDHGNGFSTRYAHLSRCLVKPGQIVRRGQVLAASGNTGRSTGPHLHFEVRYRGVAQDPARFLHHNAAPTQSVAMAVKPADRTLVAPGR